MSQRRCICGRRISACRFVSLPHQDFYGVLHRKMGVEGHGPGSRVGGASVAVAATLRRASFGRSGRNGSPFHYGKAAMDASAVAEAATLPTGCHVDARPVGWHVPLRRGTPARYSSMTSSSLKARSKTAISSRRPSKLPSPVCKLPRRKRCRMGESSRVLRRSFREHRG